MVQFNLTFFGDPKVLPNYFGFAEYTFNDSDTVKVPIIWTVQDNNQTYIHSISHIYSRFGTYYPQITLSNNVSLVRLQRTVIVEQCVRGLRLTLHKARY